MIGVLAQVRTGLAVLALAAALGCAPPPPRGAAAPEAHAPAPSALQLALAKLERLRDRNPRDFDTRIRLAETCYQIARRHLDAADEAAYAEHIRCAHEEFLAAAALQPRSATPHLGMGIVLAYQADMSSALASFENARRLEPQAAVHYVNIAEALIYLGRLSEAQRALAEAARRRAPAPRLKLAEVLIAWRRGELARARDLFALAYALDPAFVRAWDGAPLAQPLDSFEDLAAYCCRNLSCGRHMANACREAQLDLKRRELAHQTLRLQYEIERERRRRLREIYGTQADVTIEIENPPADIDVESLASPAEGPPSGPRPEGPRAGRSEP